MMVRTIDLLLYGERLIYKLVGFIEAPLLSIKLRDVGEYAGRV